MSFLSSSENVGFSGITQNISETSCATQYKMAVEGVPGVCNSEMNMFINDSSGDEQSYLPHFTDNFFHTKFKIDSNDLYTFHDSDVVAGEITVSHTEEENFVFPENVDVKTNLLESPEKEIDIQHAFSNGELKEGIKLVVPNGHYSPIHISSSEVKKTNTKSQKVKVQNHMYTDLGKLDVAENCRPSVLSPKHQSVPNGKKIGNNPPNNDNKALSIKSISETFLDVFKKEQGVVENSIVEVKSEPQITPIKPSTTAKKQTVRSSSQSKPRKGRGPTVHEALQRIPSQQTVLPVSNNSWHAPGEEMFTCGPLDDKKPNVFRQLESSSDDDNMPEFESGFGAVCVEESAAESRGARLELRRAALRRHVLRTSTSLNLSSGHRAAHTLVTLIKKQINGQKAAGRLSTHATNHLLAMRGMASLLTAPERRRLRESGWSGGESGRSKETADVCTEEKCLNAAMPSSKHCRAHVTLAPEQRLYAACAAVFAGGERCKQPLLPLQDQTPLCPEHAWKRDNYELLSRENKPQKAAARKRVWAEPVDAGEARARARRPKRRRRLVPRRPAPPPHPTTLPPSAQQSLAEINVCSNSSTYDSSEEAAVGTLSDPEYISANNSHELEVGQVPADDILDPSVLSQIPDEAFTEFFNQSEGGATFAESSELAAALEAVLDERVLDERGLDISDAFAAQHPHAADAKVQVVAPVDVSSGAPS